MADSRWKQTILGFSTAVEGSYNAMVLVASGMTGFVTRSTGFPLPDYEKSDDLGVIGNQNANPTVQRSGFITPPTMEFTDILGTENAMTILRRAMGSADPVPSGGNIIEAGIAFKHSSGWLNPFTSRQKPSSTFLYSNNGADYLYGGCVVNTYVISQDGVADPTFVASIVGSGLNKRVRDVSGPVFGTLAKPAVQNQMLGPSTEVEFTDGGGLYSMTGAHRLISVNATVINNNLETTDRRAGASPVDPFDMHKGWYMDYLLTGDPVSACEFRVMLDDNMREYADARNDTVITGFKVRFKGYEIPGSLVGPPKTRFQIEVVYGKTYFRGVRATDNNGNAVLDITLFPIDDGVNVGTTTVNWINTIATAQN
jgi:hypothetical protein